MQRKIKEIIIHHTELGEEMMKSLSKIYKFRGGKMNYKDGQRVYYPYHWLIYKDGRREKLLGDDRIGRHSDNEYVDEQSVAIALVGNFTENKPTPEALRSLTELIKEYKLPYRFHRDINHLDICPGNWSRVIIEDMLQGITHNLPAYGCELLNQSENVTVLPGETFNISLLIKNSGERVWKKSSFRIKTLDDKPSRFYNSDWLSISAPAGISNEVEGGGEVMVNLSLTAPKNMEGYFKQIFSAYVDDYGFIGKEIEVRININGQSEEIA